MKGLFFGWFLTRTYNHDIPGFWGQSNGDMMTYIQPVESLLAHQGFQTDVRMPAYPGIYLFFRLFTSQAVACNLVILLQVVVSALSVYVLGLCAVYLFKTDRAFYWAYFIYLFSTFVSVFDGYFLTESLAASASIFFLYCWLRFEAKPANWFFGADGRGLDDLVDLSETSPSAATSHSCGDMGPALVEKTTGV